MTNCGLLANNIDELLFAAPPLPTTLDALLSITTRRELVNGTKPITPCRMGRRVNANAAAAAATMMKDDCWCILFGLLLA